MSTSYVPDDELIGAVDCLWEAALSDKTQATYKSGLNCFLTFVLMRGIQCASNSLPDINEDLLILFVTHCHQALQFKFDTIKAYLAGIRYHYIKNNLGDPLGNTLRLHYILRGIKKTQATVTIKRLPITFKLLQHMCFTLTSPLGVFSPMLDLMLSSIFLTAFYGFLRCGEFTCRQTSDSHFIRLCDINVFKDWSQFTLFLRISKTDPFGKGVYINIFANNLLYPVRTMVQYLEMRRSQGATSMSPLFVNDFVSYKPLMRHTFIGFLKDLLSRIGLNNLDYNGHSFRIGAATSAAAAGVQDHVIQTLGRWSSDCFTRYIHTDPKTIHTAQLDMSV